MEEFFIILRLLFNCEFFNFRRLGFEEEFGIDIPSLLVNFHSRK